MACLDVATAPVLLHGVFDEDGCARFPQRALRAKRHGGRCDPPMPCTALWLLGVVFPHNTPGSWGGKTKSALTVVPI